MKKIILMTAFQPFAGDLENVSEVFLQKFPEEINNFIIRKLYLPVHYNEAAQTILAHAEKLNPDYIISLGQASGRLKVCLEMQAQNLADGIADNQGIQYNNIPFVHDGYFVREVDKKFKDAYFTLKSPFKIFSELSGDAGKYVCNNTLYLLLSQTHIPVVFIHLPFWGDSLKNFQNFIIQRLLISYLRHLSY
jgi:pyroglutamyl-peptidase